MTTTTTTDQMFWVIETAGPEGQALNIAFTGTYQEAREQHAGATITRWDRFDGVCNA